MVKDQLTWTTWREAANVVLYKPHLRKTLTITLVVGTALFVIWSRAQLAVTPPSL